MMRSNFTNTSNAMHSASQTQSSLMIEVAILLHGENVENSFVCGAFSREEKLLCDW